jgi:plasmid stabilization system protein ParE
MARVLVSAAARQDVRDILSNLNRHAGYVVAARYAADFKRVYRELAEFPESGPRRLVLGPNARIKIVHPFVIFYDADADGVTVLRVLHGRCEITDRLMSR